MDILKKLGKFIHGKESLYIEKLLEVYLVLLEELL